MEPCPYCSQQIQDTAIECRYCLRWLDPALDSTLNADSSPVVLPPHTSSGLAIASLVCGLFWRWGIGSIAAVIPGYLALGQIRRDPLRLNGKGMAIRGIVLGVAVLACTIALGIYV